MNGRVLAVMGLTVVDGLIAEMNIVTSPERLSRLQVTED